MTVTIMYPGIDMASINETAQWENEIYQIARGDKVEGGRGGAANIQAKQLGNRTRYLYDQMQAIMTSAFTGIYHASDEENGLTHTSEGELFFTSNGPDDEFIFSFFINQGGVAVSAGEVINGRAMQGLMGLISSVSYLEPGRFSRSPVHSAVMDKDRRWLSYFVQDMLHLKRLAVHGTMSSDSLDVNEIRVKGVAAPLNYLDPARYARVPYSEVAADKNLRIMSTTDDNGRVTIAGVEINPPSPPGDKYEVYCDSGKLFRVSNKTGERVLLDDSGDNTDVKNDETHFSFTSPRDASVIGHRWYSPYESYQPAAYFGRRAIVGFGHSFIANPRFLRTLSDLTGLPTYNFGRSGGLSRTVALRAGAYTVSYTPIGGIIPESGPVALFPADPGVLQVVDNASVSETVRGNLAGVDGTLAWDGATLTFTRDASGAAVAVPAATPFIYYPYTIDSTNTVEKGVRYDPHGEAINWLWLGRNNASQVGQILSDARAFIESMTAKHKRFVISPEFPMATETKGTAGNANILWLNRELKKLAPDNYCEIDSMDMLANFNNHYNPAYAQDVADINNGITPRSLRQDSLHPSQTLQANALYIGADVNAQFGLQFLKNKGWL